MGLFNKANNLLSNESEFTIAGVQENKKIEKTPAFESQVFHKNILFAFSDFIKKYKDELKLSLEDLDFVCGCISSHMGRFNTSNYSNIILPLPKTPEQKFVHMCDFLASRKVIHIDFDETNNIIEE